jgi:hypothetical protein
MDSQMGSTDLPRYWITLDKETIWDYPKNFLTQVMSDSSEDRKITLADCYPYGSDVSNISKFLDEYINSAKVALLEKHFENDRWGLANILKAADRRIGERRLSKLRRKIHNKAARKVIDTRISNYENQKLLQK